MRGSFEAADKIRYQLQRNYNLSINNETENITQTVCNLFAVYELERYNINVHSNGHFANFYPRTEMESYRWSVFFVKQKRQYNVE